MKRDQMLKKSAKIRGYILDQIAKDSKGITASIVKKFRISRQAAAQYLRQMTRAGKLTATGATKGRIYKRSLFQDILKIYDLTVPQEEFEIWSKDFKKLCEGLKPNVIRICEYGFTEMVNNAIDHSAGKTLTIGMTRDVKKILIWIQDNGVGIFRKLKADYHLTDEKQAILELSKGKLTTDPEKHSGQGIFFTSKAFDQFKVFSYGLLWVRDQKKTDPILSDAAQTQGTKVMMSVSLATRKTLKEIFDEFADPTDNNYSFNKTIVSVKLIQNEGESLVSRSQAKRLMARIESFRTAILDFDGIQNMGQAFADEIFRVYKIAHPSVNIVPIHTTPEINTAIHRARVSVLEGGFQNVKNVQRLIAQGLLSPVEPIEGSVHPQGEISQPSYRIAKRDTASLMKILPCLSDRDREKIKNVMEL